MEAVVPSRRRRHPVLRGGAGVPVNLERIIEPRWRHGRRVERFFCFAGYVGPSATKVFRAGPSVPLRPGRSVCVESGGKIGTREQLDTCE